jgi:hypothetical protein
MPGPRSATLLLLIILSCACFAQEQPDKVQDAIDLPSKFLDRLQGRTASLNDQLTRQTEKYLAKMAKREERLHKKLAKADPAAAKALFPDSTSQYTVLAKKLSAGTGNETMHVSGEYQAYTDSLQGMLKYLQANTAGLKANAPQLQSALKEFQTLEARLKDADEIKSYIRQRKQQIGDYIQQHANLSGLLGKDYKALNQDVYYYSQQVRQYKETLNDPDKLTKEALALLNKLPAFQAFMKNNSALAGLFNLPGNYASAATLNGLQTRDQVAALIQGQLAAAGPGGAAALQSNIQAAESQLQNYKDKLTKLGNGSGDIDMPDFKPNKQKTKTFWRRLEYGTNFQTTRNNYAFPTVSDFGLSVGYKLSDRSTVGIGASYKLGWGNGIQDIHFSSQGMGLRSFIDIKIKGSFSASGGLEYNYTTPFQRMQQLYNWNNWTKSGLIGVSKTVPTKSRVFKKTKVQLLWDFLSFQQVPRTQALVFRLGYNF